MRTDYKKLVENTNKKEITEAVSNTYKREVQKIINATEHLLKAEEQLPKRDEEYIEVLKNHLIKLQTSIGPDAVDNW
jgi:hypothetical protein